MTMEPVGTRIFFGENSPFLLDQATWTELLPETFSTRSAVLVARLCFGRWETMMAITRPLPVTEHHDVTDVTG